MLKRNEHHHVILGEIIRENRKEMGLTLSNLAKRSNVSLGYLSQIERGKNSASVDALLAVCGGLEIKLSELFRLVEKETDKDKPLRLLSFPPETIPLRGSK